MTMDLDVDDLTMTYDRHPAIHHLSGCFRAGSMTAVIGPNGAGKSTLLKGLAGLMRPSAGRIALGGARIASRRREIAYLPQQAEIDRSFPISVLDTVLIGHWRGLGLFRGATAAMVADARGALEAVGLGGFETRGIDQLSAGQFQRVLFARMMLQDAALILLDEPFNAIDARTTADLLEMVRRWHGECRTIIAVIHDFEQARAHFPETLLVARRPIGWGPTEQVLTAPNLLQARTMAERWDDHAAPCEKHAA